MTSQIYVRFMDGPEAGTVRAVPGFQSKQRFHKIPEDLRHVGEEDTFPGIEAIEYRMVTTTKRVADCLLWGVFALERRAYCEERPDRQEPFSEHAVLSIRIKPFPSILTDFEDWFRWQCLFHNAPAMTTEWDRVGITHAISDITWFLREILGAQRCVHRTRHHLAALNPENQYLWSYAKNRWREPLILPLACFCEHSRTWQNRPTEPIKSGK
jgi:hypothetical protein